LAAFSGKPMAHDSAPFAAAGKAGYMMDSSGGWMGGGMWTWTVLGLVVVALLVVVIGKMSKK
jgi:uncharacterized membrane protein